MMKKMELFIIDPQNDFCDPNGSLFVGGADEDMKRLAAMITRLKDKWYDIHVTLDSHHYVDVAHPVFWKDANGNHPGNYDFVIITEEKIANGEWRTTNPAYQQRATEYVKQLAASGRYPLCIWPPHCLIGSWGHGVYQPVFDALVDWEKDFNQVDYVTKGSNLFVEHYSAVKAEVEDPDDPTTQLNTHLMEVSQRADIILIGGEALSHCLANTVEDMAKMFGDDIISKLVLLKDATSSVQGFENLGGDFVDRMIARGMQVSTTVDFLA